MDGVVLAELGHYCPGFERKLSRYADLLDRKPVGRFGFRPGLFDKAPSICWFCSDAGLTSALMQRLDACD